MVHMGNIHCNSYDILCLCGWFEGDILKVFGLGLERVGVLFSFLGCKCLKPSNPNR